MLDLEFSFMVQFWLEDTPATESAPKTTVDRKRQSAFKEMWIGQQLISSSKHVG